MANNIVLKTFKGGSVTPQDDAIIQQTVIGTNGIFKGCTISHSGSNILHISQGFGMIKGRFFEVYETNVYVTLNSSSNTIKGRLYIHMDLSNSDEPVQILTKTAATLPALDSDEDVNYNSTSYDLELATFNVSNTALSNLVTTYPKITGASGASASTLQRAKTYRVGDFATCAAAPGWATLYCVQAGTTAALEPLEYGYITEIGDIVVDGGCIFSARDVLGELDALLETHNDDIAALTQQHNADIAALNTAIAGARGEIQNLADELASQVDNLPAAVGTIKYNAVSPGSEWLPCDGRFVSEVDYPELVAVLGKLVPDNAHFSAFAASNTVGRRISNVVVKDGFFWLFSQAASTLYKIKVGTGEITPITVSFALGTNGSNFHSQDGFPVVLSIVNEVIFLTQLNNTLTDPYVRVFQGTYSSTMTTLSMTFKDRPSFMNGNRSGTSVYISINDIDTNFLPYVIPYTYTSGSTVTQGYAMVVGKYSDGNRFYVTYVIWSDTAWLGTSSYTGYARQQVVYTNSTGYLANVMPKCGFYWRNNGIVPLLNMTSYSSQYTYVTMYGTPGGQLMESLSFKPIVTQWGECLPLQAGGGGILYKMAVNTDLTVGVLYINPSGAGAIYTYKTTLTVPKTARLFSESLTYVSAHGMWVCFAGTGFLFSRDPTVANSWGYLDTTDKLGIITQMGGAYYNDEELALYLYGMTSANKFKMAKLDMGEWFQYANDGAWLPMLASEGIPAFIKATPTT